VNTGVCSVPLPLGEKSPTSVYAETIAWRSKERRCGSRMLVSRASSMVHAKPPQWIRSLPTLALLAGVLVASGRATADSLPEDGASPEAMAEDEDDHTPDPAETAPDSRRLTLVAAGHLSGQLADVNCRLPAPQRDDNLHFARQAGLVRGLINEGREPITVNVGDSIFPGAIPRFLLQSRHSEQSLGALLGHIPWTLHVFGKRELAIAKRELARFSEQALAAKLPLKAANMHCREGAADDAFCRSLTHSRDNPPWVITERGGLNVGLIPLIDPASRAFVAVERLELVELADPATILPGLVRELRGEHEVDLVMVVHHGYGDGAFDRLHALVSQTSGVDLAITNSFPRAEEETSAQPIPRGYAVARTTGTHILGARTGHEALVVADIDVKRRRDGDGWTVDRFSPMTVATRTVELNREAAVTLRSTIQNLCSRWGEPIHSGVTFASPFSLADFQRFILGVMRSAARAEVAVANVGSFRQPELFPLSGSLAFADVYTVLAFNNRLAVVELKGVELEKLGAKLGDGYVAVGLENRDGSIRVNGRAVISDATYRVAMNSFLASGGEEFLKDLEVKRTTIFSPSWAEDQPPTISEIVVDYVQNLRFPVAGARTEELHPERNFRDLHRKMLWRFRAAIDGSYNQVSVRNPATDDGSTYGRPQLAVSPTSQINLEVRGGVQADSRYHRWNNELLLQYAMARTATDGELGPFRENKDVTRVRSQYRYNGLRHAMGEPWYAPAPFAELQLETELRVPDDRDHRRLALTGILGPELQLFEPLTAFAGFNARRDVTQPAGEFGYGLVAGYRLQRMSLFESLGNTAELESELEVYLNRLGGEGEQELRNTSRLFITIIGELSFTTTLSLFLYRRATPGDLGFNTSLTVGLNYSWNRALQTL
jgi:2',3'-cyclic-nucleotide 2'-phosphodiesterase (5'-nucleotidase family)